MKSKILVTGGAGFIGSHVADDLIGSGHEVVVLDDLSGGFIENVSKQTEFIAGSITDVDLINSIFNDYNIEHVFHLAAYAAEGLSHFIKRFNYLNNLIGSVNLINAAVNHNVKCFVYTSSIAVYGANQLPMHEEMIPTPEDSYGIAKFSVEEELKATKRMFGLDYIIFRPHNVYGERQNIGDKYRNVIGIFMNQIMSGRPLTIFGDGMQTRAFTNIRDVSPIIAKSAFVEETYNQVFNIGADKPYTVNQLAEEVMKAMNKRVDIVNLEERKEVKAAFSDHSKLEKYFQRKPECSLEEGLKLMADWAQQVGCRQSKEFEDIEIRKNLPDGW